MKKTKYILFLCLCCSIIACTKHDVDNENVRLSKEQGQTEKQGGIALSLNLEADADLGVDSLEKAKSLQYEVGVSGTKLTDALVEKPLHSLTVVSNESGTKKYVFNLEWSKTPGKNHFYVKKTDVTDVNGVNVKLDVNDKWFISGVLTYDKTKISGTTVRYTPNQDLKGVASGELQEQDIPLYFSWVRLTVPSANLGKDVLATTHEPSPRSESERIKFKPMGTMMRIVLNNKNTYPIRVKSIGIMSSVVVPTGGSVDLSAYSRQVSSPTYSPYDQSESYSLPLEQPIDIAPLTKSTKSCIVWAMPVTPKLGGNTYFTGRAFTQVTLDAVRLDAVGGGEQLEPRMQALYVWGSETNTPRSQRRIRVDAQIYRPMSVLEYFSDGYWNGSLGSRPFSKNSDLYHLGSQELIDMPSSSYPSGYRALYHNDGRLLYPTWITAVRAITTKSTSTVVGINDVDVSFPGDAGRLTRQADTAQLIDNTLYVLRFHDGTGVDQRKQLSAWRYNLNMGTIESVYLGSAFKGVFRDIRKPQFWRAHAQDIVRVTYGPATNTYYYPDGRRVESYYEYYGRRHSTISSNFLLTTLAERYRTNNQTYNVSYAGLAIDYIYRNDWGLGLFRYAYKTTEDSDFTKLYAEAGPTDPPLPYNFYMTEDKNFPGTYSYGPSVDAVQKGPVILVKRRADY